jgi:hypothetical protein
MPRVSHVKSCAVVADAVRAVAGLLVSVDFDDRMEVAAGKFERVRQEIDEYLSRE